MMEETKKHKIKKGVFYGLLLLLLLPLCLVVSNCFIPVEPLKGASFSAKETAFSFSGWIDGTYQQEKDNYLKQNYGLSSLYVRLYNELDFLLFKKANAKFVVIGKENYLYEQAYLDAYYGRDFMGMNKIKNISIKLKAIQNELTKQKKVIVTVLAPGKASYFPEFIPERFKRDSCGSNYLGFKSAFKKEDINAIDFNNYFSDQKSSSKYPLYPQYGIHWSNYGSLQAFDSILRYIENKTAQRLPMLKLKGIKISDSLEEPDNDIVEGMNLLWPLKTYKMAYPTYEVIYDSTRTRKLKLLVISDSFWWHIYDTGLPSKIFEENRFWYYNEAMYPEFFKEEVYVKQSDYYAMIRKADVILIMHSESTLYKFGNGFVDMCYEAICKPDLYKETLQKTKWSIRATPNWFMTVQQKAKQNKISVDSMLTLDALYIMNEKHK